ncbi:MAG: hypothetical protein IPM63_14835 [Acidobacteriota bacterium]|nr:MAG: hypothetical protein IPM63_14835 [Acidobacteriota bacterium]
MPILFVHYDKDEFGSVANLNELVAEVSAVTGTESVTYDNFGHSFDGQLAGLREAIREWTEQKIELLDQDGQPEASLSGFGFRNTRQSAPLAALP